MKITKILKYGFLNKNLIKTILKDYMILIDYFYKEFKI